MKEHVINPLSQILPSPLSYDRILYPKPGQVGKLREQVIAMGGIDLFVLATDPREGYVAQNFGDQPFAKSEKEKVGRLNENFLKHHPYASVYRGVTFSLKDYVDMVQANKKGKFALVVFGEAKRNVLNRFIDAHEYRQELPVSFLWKVPQHTKVYTDQEI